MRLSLRESTLLQRKRIFGTTSVWPVLTVGFLSLTFCISLPCAAAQILRDNVEPNRLQGVTLLIDGGRLVTLTNNHHLLPNDCLYRGRMNANRSAGDANPIDSTAAMNWYIQTSRKYQANYLLANAHYESLWAYQCP